ncbi:MAG: dihydrodipicolinate synthase family protein, partial [Pelagibacteraceae bacterium]|nr:dihydrodipicolinate synthase family protein [Pelagibacteraceae bacterium]
MTNYTAEKMNGVIPALITSFNKDESINKEGMRKTVNYLISKNVHGLYITGSTGETFLMSPDEKKKVIEIIVDEVNGRIPVIAHIGSIGTKITIELGKHAEKIGVDALSALPPFYYGFSNNEIHNYYSDISHSSNLPIIVYNISHANLMDLDMLKRLASIPNIKGVKYTAATHFNFSKIKKEIGDSFKIYSGMDEMALSGILSGADGMIGSFYNLMPEMFVNLYSNLQTG